MNKKGWTLVGELVVFLIAVILLIYAVYGIHTLGLLREDAGEIPGVKPQLILGGKTVNYEYVEGVLVDATKRYVLDKYNNNFSGDTIVVRVNHLVKEGYMSTIRDSSRKTCSGYVEVFKTGESGLSYSPYLKCSKYTSFGYKEEYDW